MSDEPDQVAEADAPRPDVVDAPPDERSAADPADPAESEGKRAVARAARGAAVFALGSLFSFGVMAWSGPIPRAALVGGIGVLVAVFGALYGLGLLSLRPEAGPAADLEDNPFRRQPDEPGWAAPAVTLPVALSILGLGAALFGYEGLPIVILLALAAMAPSAMRRPGLGVSLLTAAIYFPLAGVYGLWDPWETHYGEVAREIVERRDWISLWWAHDGFFYSKPIGIFWAEALSMSALGVETGPLAHPSHPEWAIRLPALGMAMMAQALVYLAIKRAAGTRAAALSALVLGTMPQYSLLAHQAITDMPLTAHLTMAVSLLALAVTSGEDARPAVHRVGPFGVDLRTAISGVMILVGWPQLLYLFSRNVAIGPEGIETHWDRFLSGSGNNPSVAGIAPHEWLDPAHGAQPALQGLLFALVLVPLVLWTARLRTRRALFMAGFYIACTGAFLAKGIPGVALPGVVALFWLIGARRFRLLTSGELGITHGVLTVVTLGLPWWVAKYVRHGWPFLDRILIHDHVNRLAAGVHGDNGTIRYFVEQLGYAAFPWVAIAPAAIVAAVMAKAPAESDMAGARRHEVRTMMALWAIAGFTLFSAMVTKFHHYIFPVVPPLAVLVGLYLDDLLGDAEASDAPMWKRICPHLAIGLGVGLSLLGVTALWGDPTGVVPAELDVAAAGEIGVTPTWPAAAGWALIALGAALLGVGARPLVRASNLRVPGAAFGALLGLGLVAFVGRDVSWSTAARPQGMERFAQLFVYRYERAWPEDIDLRAPLTAFAIVAGVVVVGLLVRHTRRAAISALAAVALCLAAWTSNAYLPALAPHWTQRGLFERYFAEIETLPGPILAYQMNWKGENFYAGGRVETFRETSGNQLHTWARERPEQTLYAVLEHGRVGGLRGKVEGRDVQTLTTVRDCNKFVLVRISPARSGGAGAETEATR